MVVADDTAFVRDRFRAALARRVTNAAQLSTGPELLGLMRTHQDEIDLIVLDLRLPQGHGVELVREIRKISRISPPIVVFSGTIANAKEVRELATLGVAGYVNEYTAVQHILPSLVAAPLPGHLQPALESARHARHPGGVPCRQHDPSAVTLNISQAAWPFAPPARSTSAPSSRALPAVDQPLRSGVGGASRGRCRASAWASSSSTRARIAGRHPRVRPGAFLLEPEGVATKNTKTN